jgi:hypothetical protein
LTWLENVPGAMIFRPVKPRKIEETTSYAGASYCCFSLDAYSF